MFCFDTMVDVAKPGDRVTVTGEAAAPGHHSAVGKQSAAHKILCQGSCVVCHMHLSGYDFCAECRSKLYCSYCCMQSPA